MPANKNAFVRYVVIFRVLGNHNYRHPATKDVLIDRILSETGYDISEDTLQKDIKTLRTDSVLCIYAPIKVSKGGRKVGYYIADQEWKFSERLKEVWRV